MRRLLAPIAVILVSMTAPAAPEEVVVRPPDTGAALVNPMMGWTLYYYSNIPTNYGSKLASTDTVDDFPGLSSVYFRLPWAYIEPQEGVFDWSIVDGPAQRWIDKGLQIVLCFSCAESWLRYATPEWVKNAGARGNSEKVALATKPSVPSEPMTRSIGFVQPVK